MSTIAQPITLHLSEVSRNDDSVTFEYDPRRAYGERNKFHRLTIPRYLWEQLGTPLSVQIDLSEMKPWAPAGPSASLASAASPTGAQAECACDLHHRPRRNA